MIERFMLYLSRRYWLFRLQSAKEFAREHPWWLEIVPFLVFASLVLIPWIDNQQTTLHMNLPRLPAFITRDIAWIFYYAFGVSWAKDSWIGGILRIHNVVRYEQKAVDRAALATRSLLGMAVWAWVFLFRLFPDGWIDWWWMFLLSCCLLQGITGSLYQPLPKPAVRVEDEQSDIPLVQPGEPFYYREVVERRMSTYQILQTAVIVIFLMWFITNKWWLSIFTTILATYMAFRCQTVFVVSAERLFAQVDTSRISIPMTKVGDCGLYNYEGLKSLYDMEGTETSLDWDRFMPTGKRGLCLKVETTDGKTYLLGMNKPQAACKLIQTALAARKQEESTDSHQ